MQYSVITYKGNNLIKNGNLSIYLYTVQFSSATQPCLSLSKPMDCSMLDLPVHHQLPEFTQTYVH